MNAESLYTIGLFAKRNDTCVLKPFPLAVQREVITSIVTHFHDSHQAASANIDSFFAMRWHLEVLGQALALPIEDAKVISNALSVYYWWLTNPSTRPAVFNENVVFFTNEILRHLSLIFQIDRQTSETEKDDSRRNRGPSMTVRGSTVSESPFADNESNAPFDPENRRARTNSWHEELALQCLNVISVIVENIPNLGGKSRMGVATTPEDKPIPVSSGHAQGGGSGSSNSGETAAPPNPTSDNDKPSPPSSGPPSPAQQPQISQHVPGMKLDSPPHNLEEGGDVRKPDSPASHSSPSHSPRWSQSSSRTSGSNNSMVVGNGTLSQQTDCLHWDNFYTLIKVLLGVTDDMLFKGSISPTVDYTLVRLLFEALLRSNSTDKSLWTLVQEFTNQWGDKAPVIQRWKWVYFSLVISMQPIYTREETREHSSCKLLIHWQSPKERKPQPKQLSFNKLTSNARVSSHSTVQLSSSLLSRERDATVNSGRLSLSFSENDFPPVPKDNTEIDLDTPFLEFVYNVWLRLINRRQVANDHAVFADYMHGLFNAIHVLTSASWQGASVTALWMHPTKKTPPPLLFPPLAPNSDDLLKRFGPVLFQVFFNQDTREENTGIASSLRDLEKARAYALHCLMLIYLRQESATHCPSLLREFFCLLQTVLPTYKDNPSLLEAASDLHACGPATTLVHWGSCIFTWNLPNAHILLQVLSPIMMNVLSDVSQGKKMAEIRRSVLTILSSCIALPDQFIAFYPSWAETSGEMLSSGLKTEWDSQNFTIILTIMAQHLLTHSQAQKENQTMQKIYHEMLTRVLKDLADHDCPSQLAMLELLDQSLLAVCDNLQSEGDAIPVMVVGSLVPYLMESQNRINEMCSANNSPQKNTTFSDLVVLVSRGVYVLSDWITSQPWILSKTKAKDTSRSIIAVLETCLPERHQCLPVTTAARFLQSVIFKALDLPQLDTTTGLQVGVEFNQPGTKVKEIELLPNDDAHTAPITNDTSKNNWIFDDRCRIFAVNETTLLTLVEQTTFNEQCEYDAGIRVGGCVKVICRDHSGKTAWTWNYITEGGDSTSENEEQFEQLSSRAAATSDPKDILHHKDDNTTPPRNYRNRKRITVNTARKPPGLVNQQRREDGFGDSSLLNKHFTMPISEHVDIAAIMRDNTQQSIVENDALPPCYVNLAHSSDKRYGKEVSTHFQTSRLLLSHLGYLDRSARNSFLSFVELKKSLTTAQYLLMLDTVPTREAYEIPVIFVGDDIDSLQRQQFDSFVDQLGWKPQGEDVYRGSKKYADEPTRVVSYTDYRTDVFFTVHYYTTESYIVKSQLETASHALGKTRSARHRGQFSNDTAGNRGSSSPESTPRDTPTTPLSPNSTTQQQHQQQQFNTSSPPGSPAADKPIDKNSTSNYPWEAAVRIVWNASSFAFNPSCQNTCPTNTKLSAYGISTAGKSFLRPNNNLDYLITPQPSNGLFTVRCILPNTDEKKLCSQRVPMICGAVCSHKTLCQSLLLCVRIAARVCKCRDHPHYQLPWATRHRMIQKITRASAKDTDIFCDLFLPSSAEW